MRKESFKSRKNKRDKGLKRLLIYVENNHYDLVSDNLIKKLEQKLRKLKLELKTDRKEPRYSKHMDIYFLEKELFAVSEMKIIYAYKHFETHLKWLIKASYLNETNEKTLFIWTNIENFLKSKNINPKELNQYEEIRDLRNLNNQIKHSLALIDKKTKNIREFQNKEEITYKDLIKFYTRIENSSLKFLESLYKKIEKDLYEFNDDRLENISEKLIERMDEQTMTNFIEKLVSKNS